MEWEAFRLPSSILDLFLYVCIYVYDMYKCVHLPCVESRGNYRMSCFLESVIHNIKNDINNPIITNPNSSC